MFGDGTLGFRTVLLKTHYSGIFNAFFFSCVVIHSCCSISFSSLFPVHLVPFRDRLERKNDYQEGEFLYFESIELSSTLTFRYFQLNFTSGICTAESVKTISDKLFG